MRKTIIAFAALAAIGMTQMPAGALAAHSNGGSMGATHGSGGSMGATRGGSVAASHASTFGSSAGTQGARFRNNFATRNNAVVNNRVGFNNRVRFADHDRFFRHHHRFFRNRFAFSTFAFAGDDGCYAPRRVWTPWGWRWRRIWVCD